MARIQSFKKDDKVVVTNKARVWAGYTGRVELVMPNDIPPDHKHTSPTGNHASYQVILMDAVGVERTQQEFYDWELAKVTT